MLWVFHHDSVLLHQAIGIDAFNRLPTRRAIHALFECCNSVPMAVGLARGRPYPDYDALFCKADALLFALSDESFDDILQAYPGLGRPGVTQLLVGRTQIAELNRSRLERMLGPEGGYNNWA